MLSISEIKRLCVEYRFTPSKSYGQNFLLSFRPIAKMLEALKINKTDTIVEVGPGFGVLTEALAERAGRVLSFEIEKKLLPYWEKKIKKYSNLEIIWGDFLKNQDKLPETSYKLAANLPYQITSKLIRFFLESENPPTEMAVLVQKEVGERIVAKNKKHSLLSLSVAFYAEPKIIANVAAKNFFPAPKVDSVVLFLNLNKKPDKSFAQFFFKLARAGFSSPRKMLVKNLSTVVDKVKILEVFAELDIDIKIRPEDLSFDNWVRLAGKLDKK